MGYWEGSLAAACRLALGAEREDDVLEDILQIIAVGFIGRGISDEVDVEL